MDLAKTPGLISNTLITLIIIIIMHFRSIAPRAVSTGDFHLIDTITSQIKIDKQILFKFRFFPEESEVFVVDHLSIKDERKFHIGVPAQISIWL